MNKITYIYWRICRFNCLNAFDANKNHHVIGQVVIYIAGAYLSLSLLVASIVGMFSTYSLHTAAIISYVVVFLIAMFAIPQLLRSNSAYVLNKFIELDTLSKELDKKYALYYTMFRLGIIVVLLLSMVMLKL